jgi:hypothetical protein
MRINTKWHKSSKERSTKDLASVVALNGWKYSTECLINMENEGFETYSNAHRLHIVGELIIFLIQVADRLVYTQMNDEQRQKFVTALAVKLADDYADNKRDYVGIGNHKEMFITILNKRIEEYSELSFNSKSGEAQLDFLRHLANQIVKVIGDKNKQWVGQYIMEIGAPNLISQVKKTLNKTIIN